MLNVLGGNKVYTVPEIDNLLNKITGFEIVSKLPYLAEANTKTVYYKKTTGSAVIGYIVPGGSIDDMVDEIDDTHVEPVYASVLVPYIKGFDTSDNPCWYTTGSLTISDTLSEEEVIKIWEEHYLKGQKLTKVNTTRQIAIDGR